MRLFICLAFVSANVFAYHQPQSPQQWASTRQQSVNTPSQNTVDAHKLRTKLIHTPEQLQLQHQQQRQHQHQQQIVEATLSFHPEAAALVAEPLNASQLINLQQSESGLVFQYQPNGKNYQNHQNLKQLQETGLNLLQNQQLVSGTGLNLQQIHPQYLVQNPGVTKQPILFYPVTPAVGYQNSVPAKSAYPLLNAYPGAGQLVLPPYSQQFVPVVAPTQSQKTLAGAQNLHGLINKGKVENVGLLANYKGRVIEPVIKQDGGAIFAQQNQNGFRDENPGIQEAGTDFSKMFQSFFNSGPFAQTFQLNGEKTPEATNLAPINNNNNNVKDFHNFFGELNESPSLKTNIPQAQDQFQPCNFFQNSNTRVEDDDTEKYSTNKKTNQVKNRPSYNEDHSSEEDDEEPENYHRTPKKYDRYRNSHQDDDDDEGSSEESSKSSNYPRRYEGSSEESSKSANYPRRNEGSSEESSKSSNYPRRNEGSSEESSKSSNYPRRYEGSSDESSKSSNYPRRNEGSSEESSKSSNYPRRYEGKHHQNDDDDNSSRRPNNQYKDRKEQYTGKSSNHRRVKPNHDRARKQQSSEEDDDERSGEISEVFETNYNEAKTPYVYSKGENTATPRPQVPPHQNAGTFYNYNFPPAPKFGVDPEVSRKPQEQRPELSRRPQTFPVEQQGRVPPVREGDAQAYYSNLKPQSYAQPQQVYAQQQQSYAQPQQVYTQQLYVQPQ